MVKVFLPVKMSFPTLEQFDQNKVLHDNILKCQEMPTEVIYRIENDEKVSTKIGSVMVINLVDKDGTSLKAFTTSCLKNDLRDFSLDGEWFIRPLGK